MTDSIETPIETPVETKVEPEVMMLLKENATLKNWVVGMIQGCEGCLEEAGKWAESLGASHEAAELNGEVKGEVEG